MHAILAEVSKIKRELSAFFACLYYAALRPGKPSPFPAATSLFPAPVEDADPGLCLPTYGLCLGKQWQTS